MSQEMILVSLPEGISDAKRESLMRRYMEMEIKYGCKILVFEGVGRVQFSIKDRASLSETLGDYSLTVIAKNCEEVDRLYAIAKNEPAKRELPIRTTIAISIVLTAARILIGLKFPPEQFQWIQAYKDTAHIFTGALAMAWWIQRASWQKRLFWFMCAIEIAVAVFSRTIF